MWRLDTAHEMIPPACDGGEKDAVKRLGTAIQLSQPLSTATAWTGFASGCWNQQPTATPLVPQMRGMPLPAG